MLSPKVVLCVHGTWGDLTAESAKMYLEACVIEPLQQASELDSETQKKVPVARVEVVDTCAQARERLGRGGVDVLVLNSRSNIRFAREIKREHPHLQVFVLTGIIPEDEIMIVSKEWLAPGDPLTKILVHTTQGL